jgi:hypothetical protein
MVRAPAAAVGTAVPLSALAGGATSVPRTSAPARTAALRRLRDLRLVALRI